MTPKIIKIKYKNNFIYYIRFADGRAADVDLKPFLWGEAFVELKDKTFFKKAFIDKTTGTIMWPNGLDLAPEALYEKTIETFHNRSSSTM